MERRKSSKSKKDVKLMLSCTGPPRDSSNKTSTSFYEIDIQSYVYKKPKKYVKKKTKEEKTVNQIEYENHILKSHYPILITAEDIRGEDDDDEVSEETEESDEDTIEPDQLEEPEENSSRLKVSEDLEEKLSRSKGVLEEKVSRLKEPVEMEEKPSRVKEPEEVEKKVSRLREPEEVEENESRMKELDELEEKSRRLKELEELEEKANRLKESEQLEEKARRLKELEELEEKARRLKELEELEEKARRLKELEEWEEKARRLKELEELEEKASRLKELEEFEEKTRRLKELEELEEKANRLKELEEFEEKARRLKELEEFEEKARRLKELEEFEEKARRLKELEEFEEKTRRLKELEEFEEKARRLRELEEFEEKARRLEELEENANRLRELEENANRLRESEEPKKELKAPIEPIPKRSGTVEKCRELETKITTSIKKVDKENQSPSFDTMAFRKQLKSYIIENFISSRQRDMREFVQTSGSNMDSNEVHLHHHEHHHHYYLDNISAIDTFSWPQPAKEYVRENRRNWSKPSRKDSQATYYCQCRMPSSETCCKKHCEQTGSSTDESADRPSEFIQSHEYSETDIKKQDSSDDMGEKSKSSMETLQHSYNVLMNSLKSFNDFTSPMIITNHKAKPKISYVHCECRSNISLDLTAEFTAETTELETDDTRSEITVSSRGYRPQNSNQGNLMDKPALDSITSSEDTATEMKYRKKRSKKERRKMEQDLRWKEDKRLRKMSLFGRYSSYSNEIKDQRQVSVYSSKTFIFHVNKICDCSKGEELSEKHSLTLI